MRERLSNMVKPKSLKSALMDQALDYEKKGNYDEAIECYDKALAINPQYVPAWNNKGLAYDKKGNYDKAIRCYDEALTIDPRYATAWSNKGLAYCNKGNYDEAIRCYDNALAIDPRDATTWGGKAFAYGEKGSYDEAIRCNDNALAIDPRDATTWYNKGFAYDNKGNYDEAIRCYDNALAIDPRDATTWGGKGFAYYKKDNYDEAIRCYDNALAIDPRDATTWEGKAFAYHKKGNYDEAIRCYDNALAIDPQNATTWYNKGFVYRDKSNYDEAIRCYDNALAIDPQNATAWTQKGTAYISLGNHKEALKCCKRAIELDNANDQSWSDFGLVLYRSCDYKGALRYFNKAIEINAKAPRYWRGSGYAQFCLKQHFAAEASFDKALEINRENPFALQGKALLAYIQGDELLANTFFHQAELHCAKIDQVDFYVDRGQVFMALGYAKEAEQVFDIALDLNPYYIPAIEFKAQLSKMKNQQTLSESKASVSSVESALTPDKGSYLVSDAGRIEMGIGIPFDQLKFKKSLGIGSFGEVHKGKYQYSLVAIKCLHNQTPQVLSEFKQELSLMMNLRSNYIIRTEGGCFEQGRYAIVMEYGAKGALSKLLRNPDACPEKDVKKIANWKVRYQIALDIARGLIYLHHHKPMIIHADLKSDNVILDQSFRAKLTDFGVSKLKISESRSTLYGPKSAGTYPWMAPEVLDGDDTSTASDSYSFGVTLWELGARKIPFAGKKESQIINLVVNQGSRETISDDTPPSMVNLITQCWSKRQEDRPTLKQAEKVLAEEYKRQFRRQK